jgi:hypothetical protein
VHLRDTEAGLPGFKEAWDAWVDQASLPVRCCWQLLSQRHAVIRTGTQRGCVALQDMLSSGQTPWVYVHDCTVYLNLGGQVD